jgi:hypothetical protein
MSCVVSEREGEGSNSYRSSELLEYNCSRHFAAVHSAAHGCVCSAYSLSVPLLHESFTPQSTGSGVHLLHVHLYVTDMMRKTSIGRWGVEVEIRTKGGKEDITGGKTRMMTMPNCSVGLRAAQHTTAQHRKVGVIASYIMQMRITIWTSIEGQTDRQTKQQRGGRGRSDIHIHVHIYPLE